MPKKFQTLKEKSRQKIFHKIADIIAEKLVQKSDINKTRLQRLSGEIAKQIMEEVVCCG